MDFKYSVDHSTSVDGITIRSLKSHEDVERVLEYYMDHFWTGACGIREKYGNLTRNQYQNLRHCFEESFIDSNHYDVKMAWDL